GGVAGGPGPHAPPQRLRVRPGAPLLAAGRLRERRPAGGRAGRRAPIAARSVGAGYDRRMPITVATWNVNGIRAREGQFLEWVARDRPDVICLQEIKATPE